ncbi:MAG: PilZ domain-containing protein [Desulfobulbaceae bacterium]
MKDTRKRRFTRINIARTARLDFQDANKFTCRIKNLSLGGLYLFSRAPRDRDSQCRVVFHQSAPGADMAILANARVVRQDKNGMAMEFISMTYDSYMLLKMILLNATEDPVAVSLEYANHRPFKVLPHNLTFSRLGASGK